MKIWQENLVVASVCTCLAGMIFGCWLIAEDHPSDDPPYKTECVSWHSEPVFTPDAKGNITTTWRQVCDKEETHECRNFAYQTTYIYHKPYLACTDYGFKE